MNELKKILNIQKQYKYTDVELGLLSFYSGYASAYNFDLEIIPINDEYGKYILWIGLIGINSAELTIKNNSIESYHEEHGLGFHYTMDNWIDNPTTNQICEMLRTFKTRNQEG